MRKLFSFFCKMNIHTKVNINKYGWKWYDSNSYSF